MGYGTRRVGAHEWRALREIRLEALRDTPIGFGERYQSALTHPERFWRERAQRGAEACDTAMFVALDGDGRFVGTAGVYTDAQAAPGEQSVIYSVYVSPGHRGAARGVASALFDAVVAWARGAGAAVITLSVHEDNRRALAFYRRYGFVATGEKRPYTLDETASLILMRYPISAEG